MGETAGTLYIVATPIGNLGDFTARAREVLAGVDAVAAEDTRHTAQLLQHYGIHTQLLSLHEHNEPARVAQLLERLQQGRSVALVSDAGTPLISDPGYRLVRAAAEAGVKVSPIPGPCAAIAALSAAGLPSDRFSFEGFLPAKAGARRQRLSALAADPRTLVFYEAPHRLSETLQALMELLGSERQAALARELTKTYETFYRGSLQQLFDAAQADPNMHRGEIVIMVQGAEASDLSAGAAELDRLLAVLLEELPVAQAARLAAGLTGIGRNEVYRRALALGKSADEG